MSEQTTKARFLSPAAKKIFTANFVAGTLEILSALILYGFVFSRVSAQVILQAIASALLGKVAFEGGAGTDLLGLGIHYSLSLAFASFYFFLFPVIPFLKKNRIAIGLLYGLCVWMVMNLAVLPLIGYSKFDFRWVSALRGALILMFALGLPISFIVSKYYSKIPLSPHSLL